MKCYILIVVSLIIFIDVIKSQERTIDEVKTEAYTLLLSANEDIREDIIASQKHQDDMKIAPIERGNTTYLYVVNMSNKGWVIVSNEQRYPSIIGYSTDSNFDTDQKHQPEALKLLLNYHMDMIDSLRESPSTFFSRVSTLSHQLYSHDEPRSETEQILLMRNGIENKWNQSRNNGDTTDSCNKVYNKFCPDFYNVSCGRTLAGCTAVAIAQILWYWRWPDFALVRDFINMAGTQYGTERRHYYDWDNILPRMDNNTPMYQVDMIAGLLRDCGFTANMLYTGSGSAAGVVKLETALSRFHMHWIYNFNYAWTDVTSLLISEIQAERPVICQAGEEGSGLIHTFVIDGYNSTTGLFHVNFGWGGYYNGMWNIGFNGYTVARSFYTELYPDCSFYNPSISDIGQNIIQANQAITLYSLHNVNLSQLVVESSGHLNVSAGETITLGNGFHAKSGSIVRLSPNFNCVASASSAPVSLRSRKDTKNVDVLTAANLYVSPNPAIDNINIHCDIPIKAIYWYNVNGQMVLQTSCEQINIAFLPKGLYIIHAVTEDGQILQTKLIHE